MLPAKDLVLQDMIRVSSMLEDDVNLTRRKYRELGTYSSDQIEAVFGSFLEAKRTAGLHLTRPQSQLMGQIAKHQAHDKLREFTIDRIDYAEMYRKPTGRRFQTMMAASDLHDTECDSFYRRVFLDSVTRVQPDVIVLNGDIFDLPEFGKYNVDPRDWDVIGRIAWVHKFLNDIREAAPDTEIVFIEGNHEARLLRHLAEQSPALQTILSDLHGFTVPSLLGLDKFEVRYVGRADLGAFTKGDLNREIEKNHEVFFDCVLAHHFPHGRDRGVPGFNGHHHKFEVRTFMSHVFGSSIWLQLGCGHRREASYCEADKWNMGFLIAHIDSERQRSSFNYVPVGDFAEVGGKFYVRAADES